MQAIGKEISAGRLFKNMYHGIEDYFSLSDMRGLQYGVCIRMQLWEHSETISEHGRYVLLDRCMLKTAAC